MDYPTVKTYMPKAYTEYFIQYLNENKHRYDIFYYEKNPRTLQVYGLTEKSLSWARFEANRDSKEFSDYIEKVLDLMDLDYLDFSAYIKTCYLPVTIHVDSDKDPSDQVGTSLIIPLTFDKNIHTILWNKKVPTIDHVRDFLKTFAEYPIYENNLNYDEYGNVWDPCDDPHLMDHLEVEEIFAWEKDFVYGFDRRKMHASNNYRKFGIESKDFILIHLSTTLE